MTSYRQCFRDANQISRSSTSKVRVTSLTCSVAARRASVVFIASPRAPPVICEALKRVWCRQWSFYRRTVFFCRSHTRRLPVIKLHPLRLVYRAVEISHFSWYSNDHFVTDVAILFNYGSDFCGTTRILTMDFEMFVIMKENNVAENCSVFF